MNVIDPDSGRILGRIVPTLQERILATITRTPTGCWLWLGSINPRGYGTLRVGNRTQKAHRISYEAFVGRIPDGFTIDHYRRNLGPRAAPCSTACVNPAHLEPTTLRENVLRGMSIPRKQYRLRPSCKRGHPFDSANTRYRKDRKGRICVACWRQYKEEKGKKAWNATRRERRRLAREAREANPS